MSDTGVTGGGAAKGRSWGRIALLVSLALNLLFVGALAGAGWMRHHRFPPDGPPGRMIDRLLRDLPADKQTTIRTIMEKHRAEAGPLFKAMRQERQNLKNVLHADPFDAAAVRKVTAQLIDLRSKLENDKADLLVEVLQPLTPDERGKLLSSRFFRRLLGDRHRRHGPPPPPPPPPGDR